MITSKNVKKKLNNYKYVMELKTLTSLERDILYNRFRQISYKKFNMCVSQLSVDDAKHMVQQTFSKIEQHIIKYQLQNCFTNNILYRNRIMLTGYKPLSDRTLIRALQNEAKRLKKYRDQAIARKKAEIARLKQEQKLAAENLINANRARAKTVVICSSRNDAANIINQLKERFKL